MKRRNNIPLINIPLINLLLLTILINTNPIETKTSNLMETKTSNLMEIKTSNPIETKKSNPVEMKTWMYRDCQNLGIYFCIGTRDNITSYTGEGCMVRKDCQVVLRGHRRISARRINWTVCGATSRDDQKRHWIRFMASNHAVAVIKDVHGYLIFPKEHLFVDCIPLNVTRVTIVHEDSSTAPSYEQLSQSERTASYTIRGSWVGIEEETDQIVDCHSVETGYIATYTDKYRDKVTFRVDYNQPIQVSLIDWYYKTDVYGNKAKDEDYHVQNVIQNQDLVKIWEKAVRNPQLMVTTMMVTTTMVTVPGGSLTEVIKTERPAMKPVVTVETMKAGQTTNDDDDRTMTKPRKGQEKEGSKNNKFWIILIILILSVAIILAVIRFVFWQQSKSKRDQRAEEAARRLRLIHAIDRVNEADDEKGGASNGSKKGDIDTISTTSTNKPTSTPPKKKSPNPYSVASVSKC